MIDNSQKEPGRYSGISIADSTRMIVTGNRCGADTQVSGNVGTILRP